MRPVVFAHGLEGHPDGRKPRAMRQAGLTVVAPDGREQPLDKRVEGVVAALTSLDRPVLVGSSYGGLAALAIARDHPETFDGLVLCAPALTWNEPPAGPPHHLIAPPGTVVIHGGFDAIIPVGLSRLLVSRSIGVVLEEVDDGHRLSDSLDLLVEHVLRLARHG